MTERNMGDYALWKDIEGIRDTNGEMHPIVRELYANGEAMNNVIFPEAGEYPGDIVPIGDYEGQNFAYHWWREGRDSSALTEFGRLRAKGYEFATTDKFKLIRESWRVEGDRIYHADLVLMACPKDTWEANEKKKRHQAVEAGRMDDVEGEFSELVERTMQDSGIEMEAIKPRKRN